MKRCMRKSELAGRVRKESENLHDRMYIYIYAVGLSAMIEVLRHNTQTQDRTLNTAPLVA